MSLPRGSKMLHRCRRKLWKWERRKNGKVWDIIPDSCHLCRRYGVLKLGYLKSQYFLLQIVIFEIWYSQSFGYFLWDFISNLWLLYMKLLTYFNWNSLFLRNNDLCHSSEGDYQEWLTSISKFNNPPALNCLPINLKARQFPCARAQTKPPGQVGKNYLQSCCWVLNLHRATLRGV